MLALMVFLKCDLHVDVVLPGIFCFLPDPSSGFSLGGGACGVAGARVGWWCGCGGDAGAGKPRGCVFEHPDIPMLSAADVTPNGARVDFKFAEEALDLRMVGASGDGSDWLREGLEDGVGGGGASGHGGVGSMTTAVNQW
jgi:hypothetical protein